MLRMPSRPVLPGRPGIIQRQIVAPGGLGGLSGQSPELTQIVGLVARYNRVCARIPIYQRLQMLSQIREPLHRWLVANIQHMDRDIMLDLLNQIRAEHQRIITTAGATDQIFAVNDRNGEAQQLWAMLVNGQGSVIIEQTDYGRLILNGQNVQVGGFRNRVLASFATLLETPEGRKLIRKLLNHPVTVRIVPLTNQTRQAMTMLQQQVAQRRNTGNGFRIGPPPPVVPQHAGLSPGVTFADPVPFIGNGGFNLDAYVSAVVGTKANIDLHNGGTLPPLNGGVLLGSAAIVAVEPNLDDADIFAVNAQGGGPLTTPLFLTLAHELLHAKRMTRGRSRVGHDQHYDNLEERRAIAGPNTSENLLRTAYGLGTRFGHGGALRNQIPPPFGGQLVLYQPPPMVGGGQLVPYQPPQQNIGGGQLVLYRPPVQAPQSMALVPYRPPPQQNMALLPYQQPQLQPGPNNALVLYRGPPNRPRVPRPMLALTWK
ncbi:MAG: hypothetical protein KJ904_03845 [Alphaproteobacteria bacterium]|nr:hypothetical protein [Alphaproteobacteria bacterium]MBU0795583.1 hypothetical protein [Alphaproteobacteria bacterium]MBU0886274.1 hypothetical protein [Alphaproteobacteria bacterium]MBU1815119.1 hypothetical protein [Alphaproteobacteria bacterium]MBU2089881.1 hypothetical protein [Alphaproteobacteria bacterium]